METQKSLAQVKQELRPQKSGERFANALQTVRIVNAADEELKQVLRMVMVKIGLRSSNWPSEEEKIILLSHIRQNFGGHHLAEINLAFDMAIAGDLDTEANCYENFSCLYFSQVMNAYRKWAREEYNNTRPTQAPVKQIEYCPNPEREFCEMIALMREDLKEGKFREDMVMDFFYDTAVKHQLIEGKELTRDEKRQAFIEFVKQ